MTEYFPDRWVIVKIIYRGKTNYKVFGTWFGGFDEPENWRLNSGIAHVEYRNGKYLFYGNSGSVYNCHENDYGTSLYSSSIIQNYKRFVEMADGSMEILPEDVDPLSIKFKE